MTRTIGRSALAIISLALVVVAVSGGIYSGEYFAFSPPNAPRSTSVGQQ